MHTGYEHYFPRPFTPRRELVSFASDPVREVSFVFLNALIMSGLVRFDTIC